MEHKLISNDWQIIQISVTAVSSLSLIGLLFIFFTFFRVQSLRKKAHFRLIIYLCISDFVWSLTGIFNLIFGYDNSSGTLSPNNPDKTGGVFCQILSFLYYYSYLTAFLWTIAFAVNLYYIIAKQIGLMERKEKQIILLCYCIPLPIGFILINKYGLSDGLGCILQGNLTKYEYRWIDMITLFVPFTLTLICNIIFYWKIYRFIKNNFVSKSTSKWIFRVIPYPTVLLICWGFQFGYYVYYDFSENENFGIVLVASVLVKLQGFLNFLVYGLTKTVRKKLKSSLFCGRSNDSLIDPSMLANFEQKPFYIFS